MQHLLVTAVSRRHCRSGLCSTTAFREACRAGAVFNVCRVLLV